MKENYCIFAGGCFWCIAMPFYETKGVIKVLSGYSGGKEINPTYKQVKAQETSHKECIKIIYDEEIVSYEELLDIYFNHIDPYDDGGQFIDRGESYTTAIFYKNHEMLKKIKEYILRIERVSNKEVKVKLTEECEFYLAEEYHQEYGLKNPDAIEKELIESGRKKRV
ncbi:MAG: peptide-methionine (S)-S-oxide reductase MsrA [Bacilli bacterium]|nr:peptide-methionine (S)-S-oxide reductase MsrA [Bacilli bacterium]